MRSTGPALAALAVLALTSTAALAHQVGLSRGLYQLRGGEISAELTFARGDLLALAPALDGDHDGSLSADELAAGTSTLADLVPQVQVAAQDQPCPGAFLDAHLIEEDGVALTASFSCPSPLQRVALEVPHLLDNLPAGHRHLAQLARGPSVPEDTLADWVLHRKNPRAELTLDGQASEPPTPPVREYFAIGVEHILLGLDHLVFLLGLVLVGGRWRSLFAVITAFTLGHSLSLALATLGVWTPSGAWIEPAIAASIAYVGVENFFVRDAGGRWRLTLPFGFIHGFGFAGALGEVGVPGDQVGLALLLFNLGVEAGQLAVLALTLPFLALLRRAQAFRERGVQVLSAAIALAGVGWFIQRVFG